MDDLAAILAGVGAFVAVKYLRPRKTAVKSATCVFHANDLNITGSVEMHAINKDTTQFVCSIDNLAPGKHGFHIHRLGDLREGCKSACDHYNPEKCNHGGRISRTRHKGDLGNIEADASRKCTDKFEANVSLTDIIGRMLIIHADEDDLGLGGTEESLKTGNAGERIACGVIGLC